ncbi:MAG: hypothetical protein HYW25_00030 [Candidatus Aenigmarchaeota archaeon]|nr:hypothetical protein [Candidatus Aenigmarchaeota archaeon]
MELAEILKRRGAKKAPDMESRKRIVRDSVREYLDSHPVVSSLQIVSALVACETNYRLDKSSYYCYYLGPVSAPRTNKYLAEINHASFREAVVREFGLDAEATQLNMDQDMHYKERRSMHGYEKITLYYTDEARFRRYIRRMIRGRKTVTHVTVRPFKKLFGEE